MNDPPTTPGQLDCDVQVRHVIETLLARRSRGEIVLDDAVLDAHPELLPELAAELRKLALIARAREQSGQSSPHSESAIADTMIAAPGVQWETAAHSLDVRCPFCHQPLAIPVDRALEDLACSACRGQFSLAGDDPELNNQQPITRIAHFELLSRLGMGGFGTVWRARDVQLDRVVALKIPRRGRLDANLFESFLHEARIAAKLRHPNIVSVYEISRDGENVYIVSDLIEGNSLKEFKRTRRMTQRDAAGLLVAVCDALHFAHLAGIVHRDLKPGNILIDAQGRPHITDFGLAKRGNDEVAITVRGDILGTPAYMSPEQARGEAQDADRRTDIYSVGVILFELLTDSLPFHGNVVALTEHAIHTEPPSPRQFNATISRDLETICLKCLEKAPYKRYQSAAEVAAELRRFLAGDEILARPISRTERFWRWCRKNPRVPTLSAAMLLVTLLAYGIAWHWFEKQFVATDRTLTERALASVRFAAESVAAQASSDFEEYFDAAEAAASDPQLIGHIQAMSADREFADLSRELSNPVGQATDSESQELRRRLAEHPLRAAAQAWNEDLECEQPIFASFVQLSNGLQITRHPEEGRQTIGRNYAWRAYFNGRSQDEAKTWRPEDAEQVSRTYLSPPFVSEFTDEWVVVISTPITSNDEPSENLGVFGLMVRLGAFVKLPGNALPSSAADESAESSFAVLVDTRPEHQGRILQHPLLNELDDRRGNGAPAASPRRQLLDRSQREPQLRARVGEHALEANYCDPFGLVAPKYHVRWLAAQTPLTPRGENAGLSVTVQESYDETIGQPLAQMRRGLVLLSLITLVLSAAVIVPLLRIILHLVR